VVISRRLQADRQGGSHGHDPQPAYKWAKDETGRFAYRKHSRDEWTSYVSDDAERWFWDLVSGGSPPPGVWDLPVILRVENGEIVVDSQTVTLSWTDPQRTTDLVWLRLSALEYAGIVEGDRGDKFLFEVQARLLGPPGEIPRTGRVAARMAFGHADVAALRAMHRHLCDVAQARHNRDLTRPPNTGDVRVVQTPVKAEADRIPEVELEVEVDKEVEVDVEPEVEAVAPRPDPVPSAEELPPPRARETGRTLRVHARLAPDDGEWLSFAVLGGTASLLAGKQPSNMVPDTPGRPAEARLRGD